ncbi:MAG: DegT/DnrJ/EryC1/StrS aminotransferase family protein [Clostridiales bacterium]|nr:DegT/DnrJ/EryC1/StrS aminotransferase family protein [Clostridiales bacterium]MCF8023449.1 DegT/DnrJ/EryC1/StrS aminotransferase family protein [Clostridiales bacterium]
MQNLKQTPAVLGGTPVRENFLPRAVSMIQEKDKKSVENILDTGQLKSGNKVREFEEGFARYVGTRYAVAVSSGAAGIHIALMAAALGHQEEVITSPLIHPSTPAAILHQHGVHIFTDVNSDTYNISPEKIQDNLSSRTSVIMPVHFAGRPCDMERISQIAGEKNLEVVEDASHALGAEFKNKKIGTLSPLTVFSFDEPQDVYTGGGGMVVTDSEELHFWLSIFCSGGIVSDTNNLSMQEGPWHFEMQDRGYFYQMNEMQAALGLSQLDNVDYFIERREEIAAIYNEAFTGCKQLYAPLPVKEGRHSWYYYIIKLCTETLKAGRLEIYNALRAENIGVEVHYMPAYMQPYFKWVGHPDVCTLDGRLCPAAEDLYESFLTLPLFPGMSRQDVQDVIDAVYKVLGYYAI